MFDPEFFMLRALDLAKERRGFCAPNPAVGAVVVKNNQIVGQGTHWACGEPHAEVMALKEAGENAQGADIYITLEPCCHYGRTPPCVDLIIKCGIKKVFYGMSDPNPKMGEKSRILLQQAGVAEELLAVSAVSAFYESYLYWWQTGRPFVTLKLAMSLDGKIAGPEGKPIPLTGEACQRLTHEWRRQSDAILTTAKTVVMDNPALNVRLDNTVIAKPVYVMDRDLKLNPTIHLLQTSSQLIIFHGENISASDLKKWQETGAQLQTIPLDSQNLLLWNNILDFIGKAGVHDLWIEAGGVCFQTLWKASLINRLIFYIAPEVVGSRGISAFPSDMEFSLSENKNIEWQQYGADAVMFLKKP